MVNALPRHDKGHMEISALTLQYIIKVIILKVTISTASEKAFLIFLLENFFGKDRASISNATQYFLFCLVIWHQYHFDTITHFSAISYPSIQRHPLVF